jgi:hypothetical protein
LQQFFRNGDLAQTAGLLCAMRRNGNPRNGHSEISNGKNAERRGRMLMSYLVQPFIDAIGESLSLALAARQPTIELGNDRALVEEGLPVLR